MARFGRYEILGKLGEGAMGVVYRALDHGLGRIVALKMLSAELGVDDELQRRFAREAEAIGRLSHPNIVAVYDLGEADGHLYMAMELLEAPCSSDRSTSPWPTGCASWPRSATASASPIPAGWCTATSSPPTSWSPPGAR